MRQSLTKAGCSKGSNRKDVEAEIKGRCSVDLFETVDMVIKVNGDDGTEKRKKELNDIRYDKKTDLMRLPVHYCKDTIELVRSVCDIQNWNLGEEKIWAKIGIDAGQGLLKAMLQLNNDTVGHVSQAAKADAGYHCT